jgi:hypothetical protein
MRDSSASRQFPDDAGAPSILDALAEEAEALRRAGRPDAADLLLALRRLHAARVGGREADDSR